MAESACLPSHLVRPAPLSQPASGSCSEPTIQLDVRLLDDLRSPDVQVCRQALLTLRQLGPDARSAVQVCGYLLNHPDPTIRWETLQVVEQLGAEGQTIQPALVSSMNDPKDFLRVKAAELVWRLDKRMTQRVLAQLIEVVAVIRNDSLPALQALARMGSAAQPAIPTLLKVLQGRLRGVAQRQAIRTLDAIGVTAEALPLLQGLLRDPDPLVVAEAQAVLHKAILRGLLEDSDPRVLAEAKATLRRFQEGAGLEPELLPVPPIDNTARDTYRSGSLRADADR